MAHPGSETIGVPHSVAVLSTARGSGATLLTAAAGLVIDDVVGRLGQSVILMDADIDCGGLTGLTKTWNAVSEAPVDGLLGFAEDPIGLAERTVDRRVRHVRTDGDRQDREDREDMALFPLGPGDKPGERLPTDGSVETLVGTAVDRLIELGGCLIVDCGVGRTPVVREVCRRVDHIILVGRGEPAGGGETAQLLAWLAERQLSRKLLGWVCNSPAGPRPCGVADPAGAGPPVMRLPYDPAAAEAFGAGRLPDRTSPLVLALGGQLRSLWPDVLNTGGRETR